MFNKLKDYKDLRSQAKQVKNTLASELITVEKSGIKLIMNGNMEIVSLNINDKIAKDSLEGILVELFNNAIKQAQSRMARKLQEMGGIPSLK